jgi:hypothetical protein
MPIAMSSPSNVISTCSAKVTPLPDEKAASGSHPIRGVSYLSDLETVEKLTLEWWPRS